MPIFSRIIYPITNLGALLSALVSSLLLIFSIGALIGLLPAHFKSTYELPIKLNNVEQFYKVTNLNSSYQGTHIEVKKANLEVLPKNPRLPQFFAFLFAAIYIAMFSIILFLLARIIKDIHRDKPFSKSNPKRIKIVGVTVLIIGVMELLIKLIVSGLYHDKFEISNAHIPLGLSVSDLNLPR